MVQEALVASSVGGGARSMAGVNFHVAGGVQRDIGSKASRRLHVKLNRGQE
jgi:hypothetical protein